MALNNTVFKTVAPEFNSLTSTEKNNAAALAELQVAAGKWLKKTDYGVALMTAHILVMADPLKSDKGGPVTSTGVGPLSRSYGSVDFSKKGLLETSYGREFLRVRNQIVTSPMVV